MAMDASTEPMAFLVDRTGQRHPLTQATITIGRAVDNDLVLTDKRV